MQGRAGVAAEKIAAVSLDVPPLLEPRWPRHPRVRACVTTRGAPAHSDPLAAFNLALHVGDDAAQVQARRAALKTRLDLPQEPFWLDQVHGTQVLHAQAAPRAPRADASWTQQPGQACVVLTADCLPVLLADDAGSCVAAAHAGWRGLAAGVIESTVAALPVARATLSAWLGPAIGPARFEVGPEVREAFVHDDPGAAQAFTPGRADRFLADLYALARRRLSALGIDRVHGGEHCTHADSGRFYSFRREPRCGRMATLIWLHC